MSKIGLSIYGFNLIQETRQLKLYDIEGYEFIEIVREFVDINNANYTNDLNLERLFKCDDCLEGIFKDEGRAVFKYICGIVKTGEYGVVSEIVNIETGNTEYNKGIEDADVLPFYYFIAMPVGAAERGIIIFQSLGRYGIKTIFEKRLQEYIKQLSDDIKLNIGTIVPMEYVNRYMEHGVLQKIRMIRYDIPHDLSDRVGINNGVEATYEERIIHKPSGFIRRKEQQIKECLRGQRLCNTIIEIDDFDYDALKLEFKLGNTSKTISLNNIDSLNINEDITADVEIENGHPTQESILPILINTAREYLLEMGLIVEEE
ncbi:MAG: hypothetical protein GX366_07235 [Epulopiscium sp.]|nr:hypothetical protein [Candidatus Epulonipiscium sp.]